MRLGPMVWNKNDEMIHSRFSNYENYVKNKPSSFKKQLSMTLWCAVQVMFLKKNKNNINVNLEDDGDIIYLELLQEKVTKRNLNLIHSK